MLAKDLKEKIISYLPRRSLKGLFDLPDVGRVCFNRYYERVFLDARPLSASEIDKLDADGVPVFTSSHPKTQYVPDWRSDDFSGVKFSAIDQFASFCSKYHQIYDYNCLEFSNEDALFQMAARHPDILGRMKNVSVTFFFIGDDEPCYDSLSSYNQLFVETQQRVDRLGLAHNWAELTVFFMGEIANQPFHLFFSNFAPAGFPSLRSLTVSDVMMPDIDAMFHQLDKLERLELRDVDVKQRDLQYLSPTITDLTLIRSLAMSGGDTALQFPPRLRYLRLEEVECANRLRFDISRHPRLSGLNISACSVRSLSDLALPGGVQHLTIAFCAELKDLATLERYDNLKSLKIEECPQLSCSPAMFGAQQFPRNLEYFCNTQYSEVDVVPDGSDSYVTFYNHQHPRSFFKVGSATTWPSTLTSLHLNNLNLVFDCSMALPDGLRSLVITDFHSFLNIDDWMLPLNLRELKVMQISNGSPFVSEVPEPVHNSNSSSKIKTVHQIDMTNLTKCESLELSMDILNPGSEMSLKPPASLLSVSLTGITIHEADFSHCSRLKKAQIFIADSNAFDSTILRLPDCVEELEIDSQFVTQITPGFSLPRSLKVASLYNSRADSITDVNFDESDFVLDHQESVAWKFTEGLPFSIENFHFSHGNIGFSASCLYESFFTSSSAWSVLRVLDLSTVWFAKFDFSKLPHALEKISLRNMKLGHTQGDIDHLNHLKSFIFSGTPIGDIKFTLPLNVEALELDSTGIEDLALAVDFSNSTKLNSLSLRDNYELELVNLVRVLLAIKNNSPSFSSISLHKSDETVNTIPGALSEAGITVSMF